MKKPLLLVEDNEIDAFRIKQALANGVYASYKVQHFTTLGKALNWLKTNEAQLVLLDLGLPDSVDTKTYHNFAEKHPFLPVVILSSTDNYHIGLDAIRNGAQDFVEKERMEPIILERAINKALERNRLVYELEKARTDAQQSASKLTSVIDNSQQTIWLVDTDFKLEAFNKKFSTSIKRKTGVIPRVGESVNDNVHINNFDSWRFLYNRALLGEQFTEVKRYVIDNRDYYAEYTFVPVKQNGAVSGISVSARDITNKRRMMALLQAERQILADQAMGKSFDISFTNLINNIEKLGHGMQCSVMLCKHNSKLYYIAAPSMPEKFVAKTNGICSVPEKLNAPIVLNGPTTTVLDKMFTAGWEQVRSVGKTFGYDTIYSFPILSSRNTTLGCITAYYKTGVKTSKLDFEIIERIKILASAIIEKKISDETITANEMRFRALIEKSPEVILLLDEKVKMQYASPSASKNLGLKTNELESTTLFKYLHKEDLDDVKRKLGRLLKKPDSSCSISMQLANKKGEWRKFEGKATNLLKDASVGAVVLNLSDVTEEFETRNELRLRERALEASSNGKVIINSFMPGMPVVYANQAFFEMSGFDEDDIIDKDSSFLIGPDSAPETIEEIYSALLNKTEFKGEILSYRKDESKFWCYITLSPVFDEKGELVYYICNMNDISALKDTEIKLRQKNNELNTFVYKATHDLKGPLASILGLSQLAADNVKDPEASSYINYIRESTLRLDMILNDLLRISTVTHVTPSYQRIDLNKIVNNIASIVGGNHKKEGVDIKTSINVTNDLFTDETLLTSALQNLLDNAVKYKNTRAIQPYAMIEAHNYKEGVAISISDNGCGTPKEMQDKIFDMFFRGNEKSTGSGLGLYMVKKAVEKLNGDINFTSEVGVGSVFTLYLPSLKQI
jgi:PAS domain S-box-containing protein